MSYRGPAPLGRRLAARAPRPHGLAALRHRLRLWRLRRRFCRDCGDLRPFCACEVAWILWREYGIDTHSTGPK